MMRWPVLGGVRFFLALVVTVSHLTLFVPVPAVLAWIKNFSGIVAVLGFLAISGYSIGASYAKERAGFYRRRGLRILPLYFLAVIGSASLPLFLGGGLITIPGGNVFSTPPIRQTLENLVLLQGFVTVPINVDVVVWTLSIEAFFYVVTPLIARLPAWSTLGLALVSAAIFAAFPLTEYYTSTRYGLNVVWLGWAWLLGFWLYQKRAQWFSAPLALILGLLAIHMNGTLLLPLWALCWIVTLLAIGYAGLIPQHHCTARLLSLAGDASYALYLIHFPCFLLLYRAAGGMPAAAYLGCVIVASIACDRLLDQPFKHWFQRTFPARQGTHSAPSEQRTAI